MLQPSNQSDKQMRMWQPTSPTTSDCYYLTAVLPVTHFSCHPIHKTCKTMVSDLTRVTGCALEDFDLSELLCAHCPFLVVSLFGEDTQRRETDKQNSQIYLHFLFLLNYVHLATLKYIHIYCQIYVPNIYLKSKSKGLSC